jgi:S-adenosylmethionine synthetase
VACETLVADNLIVIAGEFRTADPAIYEDIRARAEGIARQVLRDAGYREADTGIDPDPAKCRCASTTSRSRSTRASSMPTASSAPATRA